MNAPAQLDRRERFTALKRQEEKDRWEVEELARRLAEMKAPEWSPEILAGLKTHFEMAVRQLDTTREHLKTLAGGVLRAVYLPLSVRNGGPEGLVQYYRQTKEFITGLQRENGELRERLRLLAIAARNLALATPDKVLRKELERAAKLAEEGGR